MLTKHQAMHRNKGPLSKTALCYFLISSCDVGIMHFILICIRNAEKNEECIIMRGLMFDTGLVLVSITQFRNQVFWGARGGGASCAFPYNLPSVIEPGH